MTRETHPTEPLSAVEAVPVPTPAARGSAVRSGLRNLAPPVLSILAFFLLWELVCRVFAIQPFILPTPSASLATLVQFAPAVAGHAIQTLTTTLLGFALAVVLGVALGALVGLNRTAYQALYPLLIGFNAVPKAALVPVLVIWFGVGAVPAVLTAFLISFFPVVVNVATGLATVEPEPRDVLRALGASPWEVFTKVSLPRSLPYFFASLKVAVTLAFVGSIISELAASNKGIGVMMNQAASSFQVPLVFGGVLLVSAMGVLLYAVFALLESRLTGWAYRSQH
ncbi:ABC transporter permease [Deinococcus sp. YIM 134068]|uniref:ABC transporter permease n=1 Tax=Deinococcus lichenicola TaxID=3118910 RepID=UPI002F93C322